jgi:hypothetical protein
VDHGGNRTSQFRISQNQNQYCAQLANQIITGLRVEKNLPIRRSNAPLKGLAHQKHYRAFSGSRISQSEALLLLSLGAGLANQMHLYSFYRCRISQSPLKKKKK